MRLDFNVLWVEDQPHNVQSQHDRIESLIKKEGFRLRVEFATSISKAQSYLSDHIYGDHIDLILMDFNLGAGGSGDQGLKEVRAKFPYKDIVFYSSQAPDLPGIVADMRIPGVFCSMRDDLPDTVDGVFEALIKKVLDIDHSRGIVMGATSDIDQYVNDCLVMSFDQIDDEQRRGAIDKIEQRAAQKRQDLEKDIKIIEGVQHVSDLFEFHHIYTSNDRLRLLKHLLKAEGANHESIEVITNYLGKIGIRNDLAHIRAETKGFSRKFFDRKGIELTTDRMKTIRQELLEFQEHFETLSEKLSRAPLVEGE
jgi:CheY-like chemotaxis protein